MPVLVRRYRIRVPFEGRVRNRAHRRERKSKGAEEGDLPRA